MNIEELRLMEQSITNQVEKLNNKLNRINMRSVNITESTITELIESTSTLIKQIDELLSKIKNLISEELSKEKLDEEKFTMLVKVYQYFITIKSELTDNIKNLEKVKKLIIETEMSKEDLKQKQNETKRDTITTYKHILKTIGTMIIVVSSIYSFFKSKGKNTDNKKSIILSFLNNSTENNNMLLNLTYGAMSYSQIVGFRIIENYIEDSIKLIELIKEGNKKDPMFYVKLFDRITEERKIESLTNNLYKIDGFRLRFSDEIDEIEKRNKELADKLRIGYLSVKVVKELSEIANDILIPQKGRRRPSETGSTIGSPIKNNNIFDPSNVISILTGPIVSTRTGSPLGTNIGSGLSDLIPTPKTGNKVIDEMIKFGKDSLFYTPAGAVAKRIFKWFFD